MAVISSGSGQPSRRRYHARPSVSRREREGKKTERSIDFSFITLDCSQREPLCAPGPSRSARSWPTCRSSLAAERNTSIMAPATRRRTGNGGDRQAAAAADGDDAARGRRRSLATAATKTPTPTTTPASPTTPTHLTVAEAADARELEELGGIDPATSFLYTPHTLTGLVIGNFLVRSVSPFLFAVLGSPLSHRQPPLLSPSLLSLSKKKTSPGIALLIYYTGAFSSYTGGQLRDRHAPPAVPAAAPRA